MSSISGLNRATTNNDHTQIIENVVIHCHYWLRALSRAAQTDSKAEFDREKEEERRR